MESHEKDEPLETRLVQVRGQVQGIGYREACVRRATALGVTGWVRNRMDGSVRRRCRARRSNWQKCAPGSARACPQRLHRLDGPAPGRRSHFPVHKGRSELPSKPAVL